MAERRKVIIDCDTGVDDSVALLLCLKHLDVLGITTVGGNVALENTQRNSRYVTEVAHRTDVPVYAGHAKPMLVPLETATYAHGEFGLGSVQVPEPKKPLEKQHAVDFLVETFMTQDDVTLITLGPMTNAAQALLREPRLAGRIREILCMGGSTTCGNATPAAEFNIYVDPEAAKIVFESGIPIKMVGLNVTRQWHVNQAFLDEVRTLDNDAARLVTQHCERSMAHGGASFCDACAVMWLCSDKVITKSLMMHVDIETEGKFTRGMTLCDSRPFQGSEPQVDIARERISEPFTMPLKPNVDVAVEMDPSQMGRVLLDTLRSYSEN